MLAAEEDLLGFWANIGILAALGHITPPGTG